MTRAIQIMDVLRRWWHDGEFGSEMPFEIHVLSTVPVQPGAVLIVETLEIMDGKVIAVAVPRDPQVEEVDDEAEDYWPGHRKGGPKPVSQVDDATRQRITDTFWPPTPVRKPKWRVYWGRFRHWVRGMVARFLSFEGPGPS